MDRGILRKWHVWPDEDVLGRAGGAALQGGGDGGAGCVSCSHTGYQGRTGIFELFTVDGRLRQLVHDRAAESLLRESALQSGMQTLRDDGQRLVDQGITSSQELLRVTRD